MNQRMARALTDLAAPWVLNVAVPIALGFAVGAPGWGLFVASATGIVPILLILGLMRLRKVSDVHITDRSERTAVVAAIVALAIGALTIELALSAPASIVGMTAAAAVTIVLVGVVTVFGKWKISVHAAVAAGYVVIWALLVSPWALLALPAVAVVGWSRVVLRDHTLAQVTAGGLLGAGCSAAAVLLASL